MCMFCVFLHDNSKSNRSRNMKFKCVIVNENISDKFNIGYCWIKVKVMVGLRNFSPFTTTQTIRSYNSTLVEARKLILSMYVVLIILHTETIYLLWFINICFLLDISSHVYMLAVIYFLRCNIYLI